MLVYVIFGYIFNEICRGLEDSHGFVNRTFPNDERVVFHTRVRMEAHPRTNEGF